jgi:hypothetical protein
MKIFKNKKKRNSNLLNLPTPSSFDLSNSVNFCVQFCFSIISAHKRSLTSSHKTPAVARCIDILDGG